MMCHSVVDLYALFLFSVAQCRCITATNSGAAAESSAS